MSELSYDQPQEKGDRFAWLKNLISDAGAGVVQGGEINAGITPSEYRPHPAAICEKTVGVAALNGLAGYSEAEQQAMIDSVDPAIQL